MPLELELDGIFSPELTTPATLNGDAIVSGVIPFIDRSDRLAGDAVDHDGPYALALTGEMRAMDLQTGNDGDELTIDAVDYTVVGVDHGAFGVSVLKLEEQP